MGAGILPIPSFNAPAINLSSGTFTTQWVQFLQSLAQQPTAITDAPLSASPSTFQAPQNGQLAISGGTISGISLIRGRVTIALPPTTPLIGLALNDQVTITYSAAPVLFFIPG